MIVYLGKRFGLFVHWRVFFAHPIVLHILLFCTFYIAHFTLISLIFFNHIYALVLCYFYIILIFYSSALSTERT